MDNREEKTYEQKLKDYLEDIDKVSKNTSELYDKLSCLSPDEICKYIEENFKKNIPDELINYFKNNYGLGFLEQYFKNNSQQRTPVTTEKKETNDGFREVFAQMKFKTKDICKKALERDGMLLELIDEEDQDEELCLIAIRQNPKAFPFVKNQTPDICMEIVMNY